MYPDIFSLIIMPFQCIFSFTQNIYLFFFLSLSLYPSFRYLNRIFAAHEPNVLLYYASSIYSCSSIACILNVFAEFWKAKLGK